MIQVNLWPLSRIGHDMMMYKQILLIALAGSLGAVCRFGVIQLIGQRLFPWGTFAVNMLGSALMGVAFVIILEKGLVSEAMKPFFMTGFLGAFTTYSAFSFDAWQLLEKGEWFSAISYIVGTTLFCILALYFGVLMARSLL